MGFDYATVHGGVSSIFGQDVDIGKGIADLMVTNLVKDGSYSVIERKALDKIMAEQNFSNSDRADPNSAEQWLGETALMWAAAHDHAAPDAGVRGGAPGREIDARLDHRCRRRQCRPHRSERAKPLVSLHRRYRHQGYRRRNGEPHRLALHQSTGSERLRSERNTHPRL